MHDASVTTTTTSTTLPAAMAPAPPTAAALAGTAAAALALGVSELVAGLLPGATSLVAAIGQVVIDLQPPGAKDIVVAVFGTNDKLALEIVVALAATGIGAGLGVLGRRTAPLATAGFAVGGIVAFLATLGEPLAQPVVVAAQVVASVAVAVGALAWLRGRSGGSVDDGARGTDSIPDPARRSFLLRTGAAWVAAVATGVTGRWLVTSARTAPAGAEVRIPPAAEVVPALPASSDLAPSTPGLTQIVVPNDRFYRIDTALLTPSVDVADWMLRIHGLVERETTLTWDELIGLPMFEQYVTIACVSNEVGGKLVGNAKWTGVRLREVLDLAAVRPEATQLVGRSVDGWTAGMPTAWVMDPMREPMIAVRMNDEPLPRAHGFPARLIVPGLYGYVSATKWLTELELTTMEAFDGYWVPLGWAKEAPILTQSRIDTPKASVPAGRVPVAGVAWAPDRGVARVEVEIDGTWRDAELSSPISDATWVQWVHAWDATPGIHTIRVRATDGDGVVQEERQTGPAPDGARGYDVVVIAVT